MQTTLTHTLKGKQGQNKTSKNKERHTKLLKDKQGQKKKNKDK